MNTTHLAPYGRFSPVLTVIMVALSLLPLSLSAQGKKKNPTSKLYVADVGGEAQIDIGESIQDVSKKSVYNAQGTTIETKKGATAEESGKVFSTMVFSNGTGAFFDHDTKVEVKKFVQEPFTPNRSDMDAEPSISQTEAFVARGTVGLCSSKQVAGSSAIYNTAHGGVSVRGKKVVIEANDNQTTISMLEGDSTVRAGALDLGGQTIRTGQQAIIRPGRPGQPNQIQIQPIPPGEAAALDDKVGQACTAKKTVYFEVREKKPDGTDAGPAGSGVTAEGDGSGVSAFDGSTSNNTSSGSTREIVVIPTVPVQLPVQYTVSPATLVSPVAPGT